MPGRGNAECLELKTPQQTARRGKVPSPSSLKSVCSAAEHWILSAAPVLISAWTCFIHGQRSVTQHAPIKPSNGLLRFLFTSHLYEAKALTAPGITIRHNMSIDDFTKSSEYLYKLSIIHGISQISDIDSRGHFWPLFLAGGRACSGSQASRYWKQHPLRKRRVARPTGGGDRRAQKGSHAAQDHKGKGERDQRGFQYIIIDRILGRSSHPSQDWRIRRKREEKSLEALVSVKCVIDPRGAAAYHQGKAAEDSLMTREVQPHQRWMVPAVPFRASNPPRFGSGEEEALCQKSRLVSTSRSRLP